MKAGDLIWQSRSPGGVCIIVAVLEEKEQPDIGNKQCIWTTTASWPVLRILHPSEGLVDDPGYYYEEIKSLSFM